LRSLCRKAWKFESSRPHHFPFFRGDRSLLRGRIDDTESDDFRPDRPGLPVSTADQAFTAPAVSPAMMCRWATKKTITVGRMVRVMKARINCQSVLNSPR
jgi:hypothetical protein